MATLRASKIRAAVCVGTAIVVSAIGLPAGPAQAATPPMNLQMPFECATTWTGDSDDSSAHRGTYEIDFNWGSASYDDLGKPVLAAASGKVVTSSYQSSGGFGNLVVVDHGGNWKTYYAHLDSRSVAVGATVSQGQKLGTLGKTSATNPGITPHLHFELRYTVTSYPSNIEPAVFDGIRFGYPRQSVRSRNCGTDPQKICGSGFSIKSRAYIKNSTGTHYGTTYLLRNSTGVNCVVTGKHRGAGTAGTMKASVAVAGKDPVVDSGSYTRYAGPVKSTGTGCVRYSGTIGTLTASRSLGC